MRQDDASTAWEVFKVVLVGLTIVSVVVCAIVAVKKITDAMA